MKFKNIQNFLQIQFQCSSWIIEVEVGDDIGMDNSNTSHLYPIQNHLATETWHIAWMVLAYKIVSLHPIILSKWDSESLHDMVQKTLNHLHVWPHIVVNGTQVSLIPCTRSSSQICIDIPNSNICNLKKPDG